MPDTAEGIAFYLFQLIMKFDGPALLEQARTLGAEVILLGLYTRCYNAAIGHSSDLMPKMEQPSVH